MTSKHARYSPSSAFRNSHCIGAVKINEEAKRLNIAKEGSEYAKWGTACHEYAAEMLAGILAGAPVDFNKILDPEKREVVHKYCLFCSQVMQSFVKTHKGVQYFIEQKVAFDSDFWGTADLLLTGFHKTLNRFELIIIDLKTGKGVEVEAEDNEQLLSYICCAQAQIKKTVDVAHAFIFQPRVAGKEVTRWSIDAEIIQNATTNLVKNKTVCIEHAESGALGEKCNPGEWCRFCNGKEFYNGKPLCNSYAEYVNNSALKVLDGVPEIPAIDVLTANQKLEIFKRRKEIKKLLDEACKDVLQYAMKEKFDGFKIVEKAGRRSWKKIDEEVIAKALMEKGLEEPFEKSLVSFGKVEKLLGKGSIDDLLDAGKISYELVPDSDKRDEVKSIGLDEIEELDFED